MKRKVNVRDALIYGVLIIPMLMCLIDSTYKFVDIKYRWEIFLLITTITIVYLSVSYMFKYVWLIIFLTLLIPKPLFLVKNLLYLYRGIPKFIEGIVQNQYVSAEYTPYLNGYMIILTIVFGILLYFLGAVKKHSLPILIVGYSIISFYYFWGIEEVYKDAQIFLIFGLILYGYNNFSRKWEAYKNKKINIERGYFTKLIASTVAIVLIAGFISNILPNDKKPLDIMHIEGNLFDAFDELRNSDDDSNSSKGARFNISNSGFQKKSERLGGPIKLDNSTALEIKGDNISGGMHLRGTIKDYYNGYMWDKTPQSKEILDKDDIIELYDIEYDEKEYQIIHKKLKTATIFNLLYPYKVTKKSGEIFVDSDLEIYSKKLIKSGKGYNVTSREYKLDSQFILKNSPSEVIQPPSNMERFVQVFPSTPRRVHDLTYSITEKYSSPYEKASAIEAFLKKNYKYNINVSEVPLNSDFVDYFLFDEKEGYCTYFASAMVVMCRITGIPARYIEGFVVTSSAQGNSKVKIKNSDAHAWVEIYFDNIGWVTFDPTPGNSSIALDLDNPNENNDNPREEAPDFENPGNKDNDSEKDNRRQEDEDIDTGPVYGKSGKFLSWRGFIIAFLVILIMLMVLIFIYMFQYKIIKKKGYIIAFFIYKIMFYGKIVGCPYNKGETIREYIKRLEIKFKRDLTSFTDICEENMYGKKRLNKEQKSIIFNIIKSLKKDVKVKCGSIKFYTKDFINFLSFYAKNLTKLRKNKSI